VPLAHCSALGRACSQRRSRGLGASGVAVLTLAVEQLAPLAIPRALPRSDTDDGRCRYSNGGPMSRHLGLDLGGSHVKVALLERWPTGKAEVVSTLEEPTLRGEPRDVVGQLVTMTCSALGRFSGVSTVGVAVPGLFEPGTGRGVLLPNLPGDWRGVPIAEPVRVASGLPVVLLNDARAFALAESKLGAAAGLDCAVCVVLGTGVGGALIIGGRLYEGRNGRAGELGHQTVLRNGPSCGCGNSGCAETLVSAAALCRLAGRRQAEEVFAAAAGGDGAALAAIEEVTSWLGIAIANVVTVLVPDAVVVGGGIAKAGELLLGPLRRALARHSPLLPGEVPLVLGVLGSYAGAVGASLRGAERAGDIVNTASIT
jgi:glucokinase